MQVLGKGEQLEISGTYGVLAVHASRYGELTVLPRPAQEPQRLIRKGQIVVNKFLEFSRLVSHRPGKGSLGCRLLLSSLAVFFFRQDEHLLRRVAPRHAVWPPTWVTSLPLLRATYQA